MFSMPAFYVSLANRFFRMATRNVAMTLAANERACVCSTLWVNWFLGGVKSLSRSLISR